MSALQALCGQAALCCVFARIARERARTYELAASPTARTAVPAALAMLPCLLANHEPSRDIAAAVLAACVAISAATDLEAGLIFDRVLVVAAALVVPPVFLHGSAATALVGAAAAGAAMGVPYVLSGGRAVGLGDVKLAAVIGLALGPPDAFRALWVATIAGGAVAAVLLLSRSARRSDRLPFAPFLAAGAAFAMSGIPI